MSMPNPFRSAGERPDETPRWLRDVADRYEKQLIEGARRREAIVRTLWQILLGILISVGITMVVAAIAEGCDEAIACERAGGAYVKSWGGYVCIGGTKGGKHQ